MINDPMKNSFQCFTQLQYYSNLSSKKCIITAADDEKS